MFRTHLLRERYRVGREILHRHEIWKKKKRRKLQFEDNKNYVVADIENHSWENKENCALATINEAGTDFDQ